MKIVENLRLPLVMAVIGTMLNACFASNREDVFNVESELEYCNEQIGRTISEIGYSDLMPRHIMDTLSSWKMVPVEISEWTIGFWPGILWYNYENDRNEKNLETAIHYTGLLDTLSALSAYDHDRGFQIFCSYGNGYRLTGNPRYKQIILDAANTLATLYNPRVGTILSWPRETERNGWPHNTIMDNMMNLEMLYWAAANGGDKNLYDIATKHAETTMKYGFREDGGNYHVAIYGTDGRFIKGITHQGYTDNSVWARGQAWAIYGYTMVYRETGDKKFLRFAEKVSDLYLSRLPEGEWVPYWDFDAPGIPDEPKDASASAITASALLELSQLEDDSEKAVRYKSVAVNMLAELSTSQFQGGSKKPSFIVHSVGHLPAGSEVDAAINYADYYYIEALTRYKKMSIGLGVTDSYPQQNYNFKNTAP